jgi:sugar (pentulose or hexulose) kinase
VAGAGVGVWQSVEEAVHVIKTENRTLPNEKNAQIYQKLYPIYSSLYHQLKDTFDRLADIYAE